MAYRHIDAETKQRVLSLIRAGDHVEDIARQCGVSWCTVYREAKVSGLKITKRKARGPKPKAERNAKILDLYNRHHGDARLSYAQIAGLLGMRSEEGRNIVAGVVNRAGAKNRGQASDTLGQA